MSAEVKTVLPTIERQKPLAEMAYARLKQAILDGVLSPGAPLVELRLAKDLGISRTPLRKAIARLEQEQFAVRDPTRGFRVATLDSDDTREIFQFREALECYLLRETVGRFTDEELEEMRCAIAFAEEVLREGDSTRFHEANRAFHHMFDRKHGNQRISTVLDELDEKLQWLLTTQLRDNPSVLIDSYHEHKLILDAVREGDIETAVSLMRDHLQQAWMNFQDFQWNSDQWPVE